VTAAKSRRTGHAGEELQSSNHRTTSSAHPGASIVAAPSTAIVATTSTPTAVDATRAPRTAVHARGTAVEEVTSPQNAAANHAGRSATAVGESAPPAEAPPDRPTIDPRHGRGFAACLRAGGSNAQRTGVPRTMTARRSAAGLRSTSAAASMPPDGKPSGAGVVLPPIGPGKKNCPCRPSAKHLPLNSRDVPRARPGVLPGSRGQGACPVLSAVLAPRPPSSRPCCGRGCCGGLHAAAA
jgi:hypothetical protein